MDNTEVFHSTVNYSGHVQGVGFRYTTLQIAKEFEVSGFVRNLVDGRVLLEAEGEKGQVQAFVAEVSDRLSVYIRKVERSDGERHRRHHGFRII